MNSQQVCDLTFAVHLIFTAEGKIPIELKLIGLVLGTSALAQPTVLLTHAEVDQCDQ